MALIFLGCVLGRPGHVTAATPAPLRADHAAVASDHQAASQAGLSVLRSGGNAVDAACATALALGVVVPQSSGIGGGGFALVYVASEKKVYALDFRERAPAAITPELYLEGGKPVPQRSRTGGLAVAVPGEVRGLSTMVKRWGKLPFSRCVAPAQRLARGTPATARMAEIAGDADKALIAKIFQFQPPLKPGTVLRRPALARTLATLQSQGPDAFYGGPIARDIATTVQAAGGVMTVEDLGNYTVVDRTPVEITYREKRVFSMPPPSSGGSVIATALGILERKTPDPRALGHNSSAYLHLLAEALKHGFADRARHLGDPDFVEVPLAKLLSADYHAELAARVGRKTAKPETYGMRGPDPDPPHDGGTTHLSVIDSQGNAVALTTTVNLGFGSRVVTEKTGIVLNNQMDDFSLKPGVENAFRLLGTEKNAIVANKRPLSSMSPTIVANDNGVVLAVGGAGGPRIISGTLQVLLNVLDFGMDAQQASAAPRIHHQWMPNVLEHEPEIPVDVKDALTARGHELKERDHITSVNVVVRTANGLEAAAEFRSDGTPAGY